MNDNTKDYYAENVVAISSMSKDSLCGKIGIIDYVSPEIMQFFK
jgi:hypothetical protein